MRKRPKRKVQPLIFFTGCLILAIMLLGTIHKTPAPAPEPELPEVCTQQPLTITGIDVSQFQGTIDWNAVKDAGIQYAFIRIGARGYQSGEIYEDTQFETNLANAANAGIKTGIYFFSQAISPEETMEEADYVLNILNGRQLDLPIVFDFELPEDGSARTWTLEEDDIAAQADDFLTRIQQAGYSPMLYTNGQLYDLYQRTGTLDKWPLWYAEYGVNAPSICGADIWQYTESGQVPGIGTNVDMNLMVENFEAQ